MIAKYLTGAVTALALTAAPAMAAPANPAAALSVAKSARAGAPTGKKSKVAGFSGVAPFILVAAAVVGAVVLITDSDDSDSN